MSISFLNRLDKNNNTQAINYVLDPEDPRKIVYEPRRLWTFLEKRHYLINAQKLATISKVLNSINIQRSDSLSVYLDKFESLFVEFVRYGGKMDDGQSALRLLDSITSISEVTVELIHRTVIPLTRRGVSDYLRDYDTRHNFSTEAIREANGITASANGVYKTNRKVLCTESVCNGPHPPERCWSKPSNFKERDSYLARRKANQNGGSNQAARTTSSSAGVKGMKKVNLPSASAISNEPFCSLHISYDVKDPSSFNVYEDVTVSEPSAQPASKEESTVWALHDTGATHHMFNDKNVFVEDSLQPVSDSNRRLKLAGGNVSLAVESIGKVMLKAGDGSRFELKECLYVPELSKNLIAGGRLKSKGVRELFGDEGSFALVLNGVALFNGTLSENGLMHLLIEPVSKFPSNSDKTVKSCSYLTNRRLGHLSQGYLKLMRKHESMDGLELAEDRVDQCEVCSKSKNTKIPHNHTRPRSSRFLENVHVDISGINSVKGLGNESYYILFCDDFSTYRHIYGLKQRSKEEVFEVFRN